jgi:predicted Ser/Thr protein kinase
VDDESAEGGVSERVKDASPVGRDLVARLARAGIEAELFGAPMRPICVGRYEVLAELGTGGMGVVYRARDPELDREIALKLLRPTGSRHDPATARSRLVREARAMARLSHPNVATVHEVGEFEDQVFVAMEYVEGQTLTKWLASESPPWRDAVDMLLQAGAGLVAAHDKGIVHRDFKPDNVMVTPDQRVLVLDFGLARSSGDASASSGPVELEGADPSLTLTGALVGTPAYMAPELYAGEPADARSDQFAFAVALWEAVYQQRPFRGDTLAALASAVMEGDLSEPIGIGRRPAWLRRVLGRGLAVDPSARYPSVSEMLGDLRDGLAPDWHQRWLPAAVGGLAFAIGLGLMLAARSPPERVAGEVTAPPPASIDVPDPPIPKAAIVVAPVVEDPVPAPEPVEPIGDAPAEPATPPSAGARTRRARYEHQWCYYQEDGFRVVHPPTQKLRTELTTSAGCWSCYAGQAETLRARVGNPECRDYALCYKTTCS